MSMLFNVLAGQAATAEELAFDPAQVTDYGSGGDVTVTPTSLTVTAAGVTASTNGNFGDTSGRFGVYFRIPTMTDVLPGDVVYFDMLLVSGDANLPIFVLPSFIAAATLTVSNTGGTITADFVRIGDIFNLSDQTPLSISITPDNTAEFCVAYDTDASANGTMYLYAEDSPGVPIASHDFTTAGHADVSQVAAAITGNSGATLTIELVRNPTVEHTGVRNVGA